MASARGNPAVIRIQSWVEEVRAEDADRALRQLQTLSTKDREVLESLSKRLVEGLLAPPNDFAKKYSQTLPNSRHLPLMCRMFERPGPHCDASHCIAVGRLDEGVPLEASCGMAMASCGMAMASNFENGVASP